MKQFIKIAMLFFFVISSQIINAQDSTQVAKFSNKIETLLNSISLNGEITSQKNSRGRKVVVEGYDVSIRREFKQKIKYFKSGLRIEKTKIYAQTAQKKFLVAKIVQINNLLFYAEYFEIYMDSQKSSKKISKETLCDKRFLRKEL